MAETLTPGYIQNARANAVKLKFIDYDEARRAGKEAARERAVLIMALQADAKGERDDQRTM